MISPQEPWIAPTPMLVPVGDGARFMALTRQIDHFSGHWRRLGEQVPDVLDALREVATIESVGASTRIEGAQLTDEEVSAVLQGIGIDSFRARDEQEVKGYSDLLRLIFANYQDMPITEGTLKNLHGVLLRYSDKDQWHKGDYKRSPNHVEMTRPDGSKVVVFQTAPPPETRWWMPQLVEEFNAAHQSGTWHPLVLIADFIIWFLAIHPFQDGNGRLSRAVTTLLLLQAGYAYLPYASLESVVEDNKAQYYGALRRSQVAIVREPSSYSDWLDFSLQALLSQQKRLDAKVGAALAGSGMPEAQQRLMQAIRERGAQTSRTLASSLGMSDRTARYHLANLVRGGRLEATRRTAGRLYSLPLQHVAPEAPLAAVPPPVATDLTTPALTTPASIAETLLQFQPALPNGRAYATVVVRPEPLRSEPLHDEALDAFDLMVTALAPGIEPVRATPEVSWWHMPEDGASDRLSLWMHPGAVIESDWAVDPMSPSPSFQRLPINLEPLILVAYWRSVLAEAGTALATLGWDRCAIHLGLQTVPVTVAQIVDIDTTAFPELRRTGPAEAPPPWRYEAYPVPTRAAGNDELLGAALDRLLRHFSYRRTSDAVATALRIAPSRWSAADAGAKLLE